MLADGAAPPPILADRRRQIGSSRFLFDQGHAALRTLAQTMLWDMRVHRTHVDVTGIGRSFGDLIALRGLGRRSGGRAVGGWRGVAVPDGCTP